MEQSTCPDLGLNNSKQRGPKKPKILHKPLEDYYYARIDEKASKYTKAYDNISYAPATEVEKARREIACLDNKLVNARSKWVEYKKGLDSRWKICQEKYEACQRTIPNFNGHYKESFSKRDRAMEAYQRENQQCLIKDKEIRRQNKELARLTEIKSESELRLRKFEFFRTYLNKVKDSSQGTFSDIREITDRYSVLAKTRSELIKKSEATRDEIGKKQKVLEKEVETKSNEVLAYRNYLSELVEYHDSLGEEVLRLDDTLIRIKTTSAQRTMIIGQIKMSIDNLYKQVCKQMRRVEKIKPTDSLGQMADIGISVKEMSQLSKDIKHMLKAAYATVEAEKAAQEKVRRKVEERQKRLDKFANRGGFDVRELFNLPLLPEGTRVEYDWNDDD